MCPIARLIRYSRPLNLGVRIAGRFRLMSWIPLWAAETETRLRLLAVDERPLAEHHDKRRWPPRLNALTLDGSTGAQTRAW